MLPLGKVEQEDKQKQEKQYIFIERIIIIEMPDAKVLPEDICG